MTNIKNNFFYKSNRESEQSYKEKGATAEEASKYYADENYETYFIEYTGNFINRINEIDFAHVYILNKFFAALYIKKGMISTFLKDFPEITNIEKTYPFTLLTLDKKEVLQAANVINKGNTALEGEGVIVGIVGTGIDYLNPRFMTEKSETRIVSIWDQSLNEGPTPESFLNGTEFTKDQINKAIEAKMEGKNPYGIVNHKDENGYGTAIAGIIGGGNIGQNYKIDSMAPKCEFSIVKLKEAKKGSLLDWGLENYQDPVFESTDIAAATRYFYELQEKLNKPVVMFLSVGSNFGGHDGSTIEERYIDYFTQGKRFSVVTSTGDQGDSYIHYKGQCLKDEKDDLVNLIVDRKQRNLFFSLYFFEPDIITIGITSPTGESINKVELEPINGNEVKVVLGQSTIYIRYFLEHKATGNRRLDFLIRNAAGGMWRINIKKDYLVNGNYNMWLQQKQFSTGDTGFLNANLYTTLMTPSTANSIIVTTSFNQHENEIIEEAGNGFTRDNRIKPTVALPSKNILTIGLDNRPITATGVAVSGAILAGLVALLFQWGIVDKNDINMYSSKIKTYLIQGTVKEKDKIYPSPEVGFGLLNIESFLKNLEGRCDENCIMKSSLNAKGVFISIPKEIYNRLQL